MKIIKMSILPQTTYRFNEIHISSSGMSHRNRKQRRFVWNHRRAKALLRKGKAEGTLSYSAKLRGPKQHSAGVNVDASANGTELRAQK